MTSNTLRDFVRLAAAGEDFSTERLNYYDCPECQRKRKFFVVRDEAEGALFGKCLSASCGVYIRVQQRGARVPSDSTSQQVPKLRITYRREELGLERLVPHRNEWDVLAERYALTREQLSTLFWADGIRRVGFPIYSPLGQERGIQLRAYDGREPKALTRPYDAHSPLVSWYSLNSVSSLLVIVEDTVSALRLSPYCTVLALLGTTLSREAAQEIATYAPTHDVRVALDADATAKAVDMARNLRGWLPAQAVTYHVLKDKDIKDMDQTEFDDTLDVLFDVA